MQMPNAASFPTVLKNFFWTHSCRYNWWLYNRTCTGYYYHYQLKWHL